MAEETLVAGPGELAYLEHPCWDSYVGAAEALIAAGLITADQLPGLPGRNKIMCTFYDGVQVGKGSNHKQDERYLQIRRVKGRRFQVVKGITEQVHKERYAAWDAIEANKTRVKNEQLKQEAASKSTPDDFRELCLNYIGTQKWALDGRDSYPFKFSVDARAKMEAVLDQLAALVRSSQVLPLHQEKVSVGKAHLRVVWSAP